MGIGSRRSPLGAKQVARLAQIVERIDAVMRATASGAAGDPLAEQEEVRDLGAFMREIYGEDALARARELEKRAAGRSYAPLVRVTVEWLEREAGRTEGGHPPEEPDKPPRPA
jgi:hypothetical protein